MVFGKWRPADADQRMLTTVRMLAHRIEGQQNDAVSAPLSPGDGIGESTGRAGVR